MASTEITAVGASRSGSLERIVTIAVAGALGAISRYGLQTLMNEVAGRPSVAGTLIVNLAGSLLVGVLLGYALERAELPSFWPYAGATGFLGAFTTFSTLMFESVDRLENGDVAFVFAYLAASLLLGPWAGVRWAGRRPGPRLAAG